MSKEDWTVPPHKVIWERKISKKIIGLREYNSLEKYVESIENQITELEDTFIKHIGYTEDNSFDWKHLKNPTDKRYFLSMIKLYSGNYLEEKKKLENEILNVRVSIFPHLDEKMMEDKDSLTPYLNDLDMKQKYIDKLSKKDEEVILEKYDWDYMLWCERNIERWYKPEELV